MECPNCNKTYDDNFKFRPYCGEEKPEPKICPNCIMELSLEFSFCPECGTELISKSQWELKTEFLNDLNELIRKCEELDNYEDALENIEMAIIIDSSNQTYQVKREKLIIKKELTEYISYWEEKQRCFNRLGRHKEAKECVNNLIELRRALKTVKP